MEEKKEVEVNTNFDIVMSEEFKEKIDWLSTFYEEEIGAFIIGKINKTEITLNDILIPEQEASGGGVKYEGKDLAKLRKEYKDKCKEIIGNWHSHNSMGAFWSSTDIDDMITPFSEKKEISIFVVSSQGNHKIRVEVRNPISFSVDNLDYKVNYKESKISKEMLSQIKKKIRKPKVSNFLKIDNNDDFDNDDFDFVNQDLKKELSKKYKYYPKINIIEILDLDLETAEDLKNSFKDLKPKIYKGAYFNTYRIEFHFKNKNEAKIEGKNIREFLLNNGMGGFGYGNYEKITDYGENYGNHRGYEY